MGQVPESSRSLLHRQSAFLGDFAGFLVEERGQDEPLGRLRMGVIPGEFAGAGLLFTTIRPSPAAEYSTVYLGGAGSAFSNDGSFLGLAEQVDMGNGERVDDAWVFADRLGQDSGGSNLLADRLARVTAHEIGHLLGYGHTQ